MSVYLQLDAESPLELEGDMQNSPSVPKVSDSILGLTNATWHHVVSGRPGYIGHGTILWEPIPAPIHRCPTYLYL